MRTYLETWHRVAHLPVAELQRENNDWVQFEGPIARNTLEEGMRALPARKSAPLREAVHPLDELFARKTLPNPLTDPLLPWWCRRC